MIMALLRSCGLLSVCDGHGEVETVSAHAQLLTPLIPIPNGHGDVETVSAHAQLLALLIPIPNGVLAWTLPCRRSGR